MYLQIVVIICIGHGLVAFCSLSTSNHERHRLRWGTNSLHHRIIKLDCHKQYNVNV